MLTVKAIIADHWIFREPLFIIDPGTTASTSDPKLLPGIDPSGLNGIQPWSHVGTASSDISALYTTSLNEHINLRVAANGRRYHETSDQNFLNAPNFANRYNPMTGELTQDYTWALQNPALAYNATLNPYVPTYSQWINPRAVSNRGDIQSTTRETFNGQADLAGNYQWGTISSQSIMGAAYARQYAYGKTRSGTMPNIDLLNPVVAYPAYPANWTANNGSSYTNTQYYFNERLGFFDNHLYLTGGILDYSTDTETWNALTGSAHAVLDDSKTMWSAGALYKITENYSVYYSHSTNASPVIANNLPLWREGVQDEYGFKSEFFQKRLSVNAAYFEISQTNVTVPNPAYQTDPTHPQTLVSDLSNKGWELELQGRLTSNLSAIASYSHLHMRDALGRMVRMVADNNASLLLNYRFTEGGAKGLSLNLGVTYSDKRAGDSATDGGNFTQLNIVKQVSYYLKPQYLTMASASYRVNKHWSFQLNLDNLLDDADYISVGGGRVSGTGLTTQPGFNARFTTKYDF
jgi:iron complex outermembrane receptor protein